ncbi:sugar transferase [Paenibacillus athensensis]|uniref:Bacterial sugar transferase domain-containing protein n=1 Tax=Paenibacillus athensensis TaxID=1967502 RepID=A0A4Y8PVJ0_9BACL|nr:sugar transferase [Paenibacillus athensensis]MCD1258762.1 sugar transferase [Paenibacillus athensensis]
MKRMVDVCAACVLLLLLLPVGLIVAALVRWRLGSPVLFRQQRAGYRGRPFRLYKFRTMTDARAADGALLPDEERLTALGKLMRKYSLDELPQLLNIVAGEMSFIGPRPLLMAYLERYTPEQMRRHEVRPGITGWAQINGRNAISWEEKFRLDVWYVDHRSWALDAKIVWLTVLRVIRPSGISQQGHATMPEFRGGSEHTHGQL